MNECVGVYVRVSTQEQAREGFSIGEQIDRLKAYCAALKWSVYRVYNDAGYSGSNTDRPALKALLDDVKRGKVSKVVVYKLDRLSRSQKDTICLIEDNFLSNGVDFVSMSENFDTATPFGKAMIGILSVFAQLEREQIKERSKMGIDARAKKGLYHGSTRTPIGYRYESGKLLINDSEAVQVRYIFEEYAKGKSPFGIVAYLNENGMVHQYGKWTYGRMHKILANPVYIGEITHNGEIIPGQHDGIVDKQTFLACQERLKGDSERASGYNYRPGKASSIFGGILYCAVCGQKYSIHSNRVSATKKQRYYCCKSRITGSKLMGVKCDNKTYREDEFDRMIIEEIKTFQLNPATVAQTESADNERDEEIAALRLQIDRIDRQIARLMDLYALENIDLDAVSKRLAAFNAEKEKCQAEINRLAKETAGKTTRKEAITLAGLVDNVMASGDLERQRHFLHTLIHHINIDHEDITVVWNFD